MVWDEIVLFLDISRVIGSGGDDDDDNDDDKEEEEE